MSDNPTVAQRLAPLRLKYPGLIPEETLVANAWLTLFGQQYSGFQYNVRIGAGDDPGPAYSDSVRQSAIQNSKLRLDAVAWEGLFPDFPLTDDTDPELVYQQNGLAQPTILEFKRRAATSAVGQLSAYAHLWANDFPGRTEPKLLLVANTASDTILPILSRARIALQLVAVNFSVLARSSSYTPPAAP